MTSDQTMANMMDLPNELLSQVVGYLELDPLSLAGVRRTNRRLYTLVTPHLFSKKLRICNRALHIGSLEEFLERSGDREGGGVEEIIFELEDDEKPQYPCKCKLLSALPLAPMKLDSTLHPCVHDGIYRLFDLKSGLLPKKLRRLVVRFPSHYCAPPPEMNIPMDLQKFRQHEYSRICHGFQILRLLERWIRLPFDKDWMERTVGRQAAKEPKDPSEDEDEKASTRRIVPSWTATPAVDFELVNFPIIYYPLICKKESASLYRPYAPRYHTLELRFSWGSVCYDGIPLISTRDMKKAWSATNDSLPRYAFKNLHVAGPGRLHRPDKLEYTSSELDSADTVDTDWRKFPAISGGCVLLENVNVYKIELFRVLMGPSDITLTLRNCILCTETIESSSSTEWERTFDALRNLLLRDPKALSKRHSSAKVLRVYGGPNGDIEGHPSAFLHATVQSNTFATPPDVRTHRQTEWRITAVDLEPGAVEAYWDFQHLLAQAPPPSPLSSTTSGDLDESDSDLPQTSDMEDT